MSLPKFPAISPPLTLEQSLNMILASIAMEELGLSHIINAEGEKLQYILGTLDENGDRKASVEEVLAVNKSVKSLLDSIMQNQVILKSKMECAVEVLKENGLCTANPAGFCRAISFLGCPKQCWLAEKPLKWLQSECLKCCSLHLSSDCSKIILGQGKCYVVSFSIDLYVEEYDNKSVCICVQACDCHRRDERFICNLPIVGEDWPSTVSASGIFISTGDCSCAKELMLTLVSPSSAKVNQASICVMEI